MKQLNNCIRLYMLFFILISFQFVANSQNDSISGTELIDFYISKNQFKQADSTLNSQIVNLKKTNQIDSLYKFPFLVGKVALLKTNPEQAANKAQKFINQLSYLTSNKLTMLRAYMNMDEFYYHLGDNKNSLATSKKALQYAKSAKDIKQEELGDVYYAIASNYHSLYDYNNVLTYFKQSAKAYEKSKDIKKYKLSYVYDGIAVGMWGLNKLDSAKVYFDKSIKVSEESDLSDFEKSYSISSSKFNLALVFDDSGNIGEAIKTEKEIIKNFQKIINNSKDEELIKDAKRLSALTYSNMAAHYNSLGFFTKSHDLLKYAYEKKKSLYKPTNPRLITAIMQIATVELELMDLDKSIETLNTGLEKLGNLSTEYPTIEAQFLQLKASAYDKKGEIATAAKIYEKSEALFNKTYPNEYSIGYMVLLREYALFLAKNNQKEKAIKIAKKSYNYILKNGGNDNFILLKEIVTLSNVYFEAKDYEKSRKWAEKGNTYIEGKIKKASSKIDSIKIQLKKPVIILLAAKSKYYSTNQKDETFLLNLTRELNQAISIIEKRKATIFNNEDISALLFENKNISEFSKQIYLDLFELTKKPEYLNKIAEFHEANIYNKIRLRLNLKYDANFKNIPQSVFNREKELKKGLSNNLSEKNAQINSFFKAEKSWETFLDSLKINYPEYYKMRYAKIKTDLDNFQSKLPNQTTIVRYLYINKNLYAFVVSDSNKSLIKLNEKDYKEHISLLNNYELKSDKINNTLHQLYTTLWQPFEDKISTKNIIIIPDGELFNLSFEMLTPTKINSFKDIQTNSLLAKYTISYNYSLLLLDKQRKTIDYTNDFVAFAPEFSDKMKTDYKLRITDSINFDKTYLKLLPQPFTVELVEDYSGIFNGNSFTNEEASKQIFKKQAKEHKIIHIGTHAESNNISPELSRLIFAKTIGNDSISDLSACETGKPTYQSGEGMISLAHAFNYAGSESILTSLWKIDEQSSAKIIKLFYDNIKKGLPKDKALQEAKLKYISTAEGRTIAPQYWAGLVLIGDVSPINLQSSNSTILVLSIIAALLFLLTAYFIITKLKHKKEPQ